MSESWFAYLWFFIRFDFDSQVNHDSRVNRDSQRIEIIPNQNESIRKSWALIETRFLRFLEGFY